MNRTTESLSVGSGTTPRIQGLYRKLFNSKKGPRRFVILLSLLLYGLFTKARAYSIRGLLADRIRIRADIYNLRILKRVVHSGTFINIARRFGKRKNTTDEQLASLYHAYAGPPTSGPDVSIIIPVFNNSYYTVRCLLSIAGLNEKATYEVIVVDDCSDDMTNTVLTQCPGIRYIRNRHNSGFTRSCNAGSKAAKGRYLVFLNNDTIVQPGWIDELVDTFRLRPNAGLVGSKLVYPGGRLQEAGCIIWKDGRAYNVGRGDDPSKPEYNYLRSVDYCSGACIMVPADMFRQLGGFDETYSPAYGEDYDLALRIRRSGREVYYQPLSTVIHFEGMTSGTSLKKGIKSFQLINERKLYKKWKGFLADHRPYGVRPDLEKDRGVEKRVLVIDAYTPMPDQDAGSVTALGIVTIFKDLGFKVTFIPESDFRFVAPYTTQLQRIGVECIYHPYEDSVRKYLSKCGDIFDIVFIIRARIAYRYYESIRRYCPRSKILLHNPDLHYLREERNATLTDSPVVPLRAELFRALELDIIKKVECCLVHSYFERDVLSREAPNARVEILPLILEAPGTDRSFESRRDIMFLGGYRHPPNVDAAIYFANEIFPLVRSKIPGVKLFIVGSHPTEQIRDLAGPDIVVTGFVPDLLDCFEHRRLSVAPLRYGAGIKGKIGRSMAHGLPCVGTTIAVEGMGLRDKVEVLIADRPDDFANRIAELYHDADLWAKLSRNGLRFVRNNYSSQHVGKIVERVINDSGCRLSRNGHQ
jgi:GT2 family glycosyltransferase